MPTENKGVSRKDCILGNKVCAFQVSDASPGTGGFNDELPIFSDVTRYSALIEKVSKETGVDANLIKAIMYIETTHGYYDTPLSLLTGLPNNSIRPMNIN